MVSERIQPQLNFIKNFQVDFEAHHKTIGKFRQIMNLKNLDVCFVMKNADMFPFLYPAFDWLNATFPGLVHKCPYTVSLLTMC